ncbi:MAG: response regulator [Desulfobacterales bacterium]|nr:response regulator [Desulfobacterales bacterium]
MNILIVEDDLMTLRLLEAHLKSWGHTVHTAVDGAAAWEALHSAPVDMVVTDWMLPKMNGLELCRKIRTEFTDGYVYLIIASSLDSRQDMIHGLESGVDDYVTKPFDFDELRARIANGGRIVLLEQALNRRYKQSQTTYFQTLHMFASLMEVFNEGLGGHCRRVSRLAMSLARRHGRIPVDQMHTVEAAGLLHDVGMVGMPAAVLFKKKVEMTGDERSDYQAHPIHGEMILSEVEYLRPIAQIVRAHHEQFNGRGFPDGLAGMFIPLISRIIAAADAYDHMVHQGGQSLEQIPELLQTQRGYQLDPELVDLLIDINALHIQEEADRDFVEVAMEDLTEGMVLAQNIRRKNSALLMPALTELTAYGIEKLKTYRKLANISPHISIYKHSVRR